jgi:hypothetical protein
MTADTSTLERNFVESLPRQPQTLPLDEAMDQVRQDCRKNPQVFLDETVVPHGGE